MDTIIEVHPSRRICKVDRRVIGINIDYLVDHDDNRVAGARPLTAALREMGVRSLRYPGGDKSDNYLWSVPPFDKPRPVPACGVHEGREKGRYVEGKGWLISLVDFDDFMRLCKQLKAEPTVVVCYDALFMEDSQVTKQQLLDTAVAWVKYANVTKGYGVKYWEIGNEAYIDKTVSLKDYARDVVLFSKAMKAVDPSIMIGANGPSATDGRGRHEGTAHISWWQEMFTVAVDHIDFIAVHAYSCWKWGSYGYYRDHSPGYPEADRDCRGVIEAAKRWGPPGLAERLRVAVTEWNAADWSQPGWPFENDLGHGLVVFDLLGTMLTNDTIDMSQLWNTRWTSHRPDRPSMWDAVDDYNNLQPTGRALAIWNKFLGEQMVAITEPKRMRTFASYTPKSSTLSVFLTNKDTQAQSITVKAGRAFAQATARRWVWQGKRPEDARPELVGPARVKVHGGAMSVSLPADSLTILEVKR